MRKREHESKIKRDSKREETGEKLEQVTLNPNAANSARFFLGARDGVEIGIGMRIDASIKISVGAGRTILQWYRIILAYHACWGWAYNLPVVRFRGSGE